MEFHPLSEIWPLMEGEDFDGFVADIRQHGQRLPILVYQDKVLEGRNRERACQTLGIPARYEPAGVDNDEAALALVVSLNDKRRHLTVGQRAMAAEKIANIGRGGHGGGRTLDLESYTVERAAELLNVSAASVYHARNVRRNAAPEVVTAVETGTMPLEAAKRTLPPRRPSTRRTNGPTAQEIEARAFARRAQATATAPALTREQMDPEFTGTPLEFAATHGPIRNTTAAQRREEARLGRRSAWFTALNALADAARALEEADQAVDSAFLAERLQSRGAKLDSTLGWIEKARSIIQARRVREIA